MTDEDKIIELISITGMSYEEAKNSWALKNWDSAMKLKEIFDYYTEKIRSIIK